MDEFLKQLISKYKPKFSRDKLFGGYDIDVYDRDQIKHETINYLNEHFQNPDIKSEEYHDYYKKMLIIKEFAETFETYFANVSFRLPVPSGTEVYCSQRD